MALSNDVLTTQLQALETTVRGNAEEVKQILPRMNSATENLQLQVKEMDEAQNSRRASVIACSSKEIYMLIKLEATAERSKVAPGTKRRSGLTWVVNCDRTACWLCFVVSKAMKVHRAFRERAVHNLTLQRLGSALESSPVLPSSNTDKPWRAEKSSSSAQQGYSETSADAVAQ